jgi:hypothetical protein
MLSPHPSLAGCFKKEAIPGSETLGLWVSCMVLPTPAIVFAREA